MLGPEELTGRLATVIRAHSPRPVLVLVPHGGAARWLQSLLVEALGVVVGARILDLDALLRESHRALAGDELPTLDALAEVRRALLADPEQRYAAIADQPSYQREVLRTFVAIERSLAAGAGLPEPNSEAGPDTGPEAGGAWDRALLDAFERFRDAVAKEDAEWRGRDLGRLLAEHSRVPTLRPGRNAAKIAIGFAPPTTPRWQEVLLRTLGFERWTLPTPTHTAADRRRPLTLRLRCAGPEAEIAAVARWLRREPRAAIVLAPAEAIPRWVVRLRHRDVPVRAHVDLPAAQTAAAQAMRALLRVLGGGEHQREDAAVARADLERVLFGRALHVFGPVAEDLGIEFPADVRPGDLHRAWADQRASAVRLSTLAARLEARASASEARASTEERGQRFGWTAEELETRRARERDAHRLLAGAIHTLESLAELGRTGDLNPDRRDLAAGLRQLLIDWGAGKRAAALGTDGPELAAVRVLLDYLSRAHGSFARLSAGLDHALSFARVGHWEHDRAVGGPPAVWILDYATASALRPLPIGVEAVVLTGLDAHPRPPIARGPASEALRETLGLTLDTQRFLSQLRHLDALAETPRTVLASWRWRAGSGARRPPGAWIAGRQHEGSPERQIGVDAIALPPEAEAGAKLAPSAPIERALLDWGDEPGLAERVRATVSHEARALGPHTGELGVAVPPTRPYSASALQRFAELPYRYFVERVLGLREPATGDGTSALLAREQGAVLHRALESAFAPRLAAGDVNGNPWVNLAVAGPELLQATLDALEQGYRRRAEHGQAEAIWTGEYQRWAVELEAWWRAWYQRLCAAMGTAKPLRGKPEAIETVPGMVLCGVEWSPGGSDGDGGSDTDALAPFELELGEARLPLVAAVDRIEANPLVQELTICDYKTGRPQWPASILAELRAGTHLQLPLYGLAVDQVARASPERLGLSAPAPVGSLRLEYLQRPPRQPWQDPNKEVLPVTRGFRLRAPLGVDEDGRTRTVAEAAARFALAFARAIETGHFPLVSRIPARRWGGSRSDRVAELARVVPEKHGREDGLPPPLRPFAHAAETDAELAEPRPRDSEVVR